MIKKIILIWIVLLLFSSITSAAFTQKWSTNSGIFSTTKAPLAFDIDGDGHKEIFLTGKTKSGNARIVCLDSRNGDILWSDEWTASYIDVQIPMSIGDLNNDGTYEIVHAKGMTRTVARNCEDGSIFWDVDVDAGWHHLAIADTDKNGLPYVFVAQHTGGGLNGHIAKIRGSDGTFITSHPIHYPCYGGITIGDINNDGKYEILINDAQYLWCFDDNLNEMWKHSCKGESGCPNLYDVNKDGYLDVLSMKGVSKTAGGLLLVSGKDGTIIRSSDNLGLPTHITMTVCDIDYDGNAEVITAYGSGTGCGFKIFDLVKWEMDYVSPATGPYIDSAPLMAANIVDNGRLELLNPGSWYAFRAYGYQNGEVVEVAAINNWGVTVAVDDVDSNGYNDIIFARITTQNNGDDRIVLYSTDAPTLGGENRDHYYGLHRANAEEQYLSANSDYETTEEVICWKCIDGYPAFSIFPHGTVCGAGIASDFPYPTQQDCTEPLPKICWRCSGTDTEQLLIDQSEECPEGWSEEVPNCSIISELPGFEILLMILGLMFVFFYKKR